MRFYTPVNEMYVCARMSALDGLWNEQLRDEGAYARAAWNLANASIRDERRDPQAPRRTRSSSTARAANSISPAAPTPRSRQVADAANERRFLPLDLIFAHPLEQADARSACAPGHLGGRHRRFGQRKVPRRSILGVDYYEWNERLIDRNGKPQALGELFGWYVIADQYWQRYRRPMMHTETNKMDADGAPRWLWRQWHNVQLLAKAGVPLVGFTWYSLTDQIDWSIAIDRGARARLSGRPVRSQSRGAYRRPRLQASDRSLSRPAGLCGMQGAEGDHAMMYELPLRARL